MLTVLSFIGFTFFVAFYHYGEQYYGDQDFIYPVLVKKVLPLSLVGFFAAVVLGAILSTFNSVLNSVATIFSLDIFKKIIFPKTSDKNLVRVGRWSSLVLAVVAILVAPMVANAPDGLYQLMQQLNGIFFIPIASVLIAGFFIPQISATGAKVGLGTGLSFYLLTTFIMEVNLHFIHIWGIEFVLNLLVMYLVSLQFPPITKPSPISKSPVDLKEWRFAKHLSVILCLVTVLIYYWLGR